MKIEKILILIAGIALILVYAFAFPTPITLGLEITNESESTVRVQVYADNVQVADVIIPSGESYQGDFDVEDDATITTSLDSGETQPAPSTWSNGEELNIRINPDKSLTYTDGDGNILTA